MEEIDKPFLEVILQKIKCSQHILYEMQVRSVNVDLERLVTYSVIMHVAKLLYPATLTCTLIKLDSNTQKTIYNKRQAISSIFGILQNIIL